MTFVETTLPLYGWVYERDGMGGWVVPVWSDGWGQAHFTKSTNQILTVIKIIKFCLARFHAHLLPRPPTTYGWVYGSMGGILVK